MILHFVLLIICFYTFYYVFSYAVKEEASMYIRTHARVHVCRLYISACLWVNTCEAGALTATAGEFAHMLLCLVILVANF